MVKYLCAILCVIGIIGCAHKHTPDQPCEYHKYNPQRTWQEMTCKPIGDGVYDCGGYIYTIRRDK